MYYSQFLDNLFIVSGSLWTIIKEELVYFQLFEVADYGGEYVRKGPPVDEVFGPDGEGWQGLEGLRDDEDVVGIEEKLERLPGLMD